MAKHHLSLNSGYARNKFRSKIYSMNLMMYFLNNKKTFYLILTMNVTCTKRFSFMVDSACVSFWTTEPETWITATWKYKRLNHGYVAKNIDRGHLTAIIFLIPAQRHPRRRWFLIFYSTTIRWRTFLNTLMYRCKLTKYSGTRVYNCFAGF